VRGRKLSIHQVSGPQIVHQNGRLYALAPQVFGEGQHACGFSGSEEAADHNIFAHENTPLQIDF
jgi:hypothetical protein